MGDGNLSQDEIDALLMGTDDLADGLAAVDTGAATDAGMGAGGSTSISPSQKEIVEDSLNEAMAKAAVSLGTILNKTVTISNASLDEVPKAGLLNDAKLNSVAINLSMGSTPTSLIFSNDFSKKLSMVMMGTDQEPAELTEAHLSSLNELGSPFIGAIDNSLKEKFKDNLFPGAATANKIVSEADLSTFDNDPVIKVTYNINVEGIPSAKVIQYINSTSVAKWAQNSISVASGADVATTTLEETVSPKDAGVTVSPVSFPSLQPSTQNVELPANYELLLDVQMNLTVELGRTKKLVKDVLQLGEGSIIELDKLAGEPVDLLINDKKIAQGEVVVIDENFGVRVTDIVGPAERLMQLSEQA